MSIRRTLHFPLAVVSVGSIVFVALALSERGVSGAAAISPTAVKVGNSTSALRVVRRSIEARLSSCDKSSTGSLSYHYPIKPFDRQHAIRGYFGDPRTPGKDAVYAPGGNGPFNFHSGVDIVAAGGTPVYSVVSGVTIARSDNVKVYTKDKRRFQYYHILPSVRSGRHVVAYKTVIGYVLASHQHVHLTEVDRGVVQNPLAPGHLEPYRDRTAPVVDAVHLTDEQGQEAEPLQLQGVVHISAEAHDMPALPVEGDWPGLGVTPAAVEWNLTATNGQAVIPWRTIADFRRTEPPNEDFWNVYAPGTHQNKFGSPDVEKVRLVGLYSYNLTQGDLDTRNLPDGSYTLTVRAADTCGNAGSLSEQVAIANPEPGSD
jgi:hypothetical protein